MAAQENAASEALKQLKLKLKSQPAAKATPLSLPLALSNGATAPHSHGNGSGNCTCSRGGSAPAPAAAASSNTRAHSSTAHYEAPPPPSPTSSHLHSLAMSTVGIPPGPTSPRTPQQIQEQMVAIEEGLKVGVVESTTVFSSDGYAKQLIAARKLRDLICTNRDELIHELLERRLVPSLMGWLHPQGRLEVQVEALWALTNFVAGASEHAAALVQHGAVAALRCLLVSDSHDVSQQVVWLLGNLAGEGAASRDAVVAGGVLTPLVECLERHQGSKELLRIGSWALSNMCEGAAQAQQDVQQQVMPALSVLLQHPGADAETLSHTCWAVSHLCDGPGAHVTAVVEAGAVWRLVELLGHPSWRVVKPALRTIGNIVCAEDEVDYTQHVIDAGAVQCLRQLIAHQHREIQKEACWTLSNIAAGTVDQIQTVLDSESMPLVITLITTVKDQEVKTEACWVVLNATSCGSDAQIEYLVQLGCIAVLTGLLTESSMAMMALEGLERILQVGDRRDRRERALAAAMAVDAGARSNATPKGQAQQRSAPFTKGNPFAPLVQVSRLKALEVHSGISAVAKRASAVRKLYYVTCTICQRTFARGTGETHFCDECQCDVCASCDCVRFHLSYLQEQWGALDGQEREAQAQARLKKARKKKRAKEKQQSQQKDTPLPAPAAAAAAAAAVSTARQQPPPPPAVAAAAAEAALSNTPPSPPAKAASLKRQANSPRTPAAGAKGSGKGAQPAAAAAAAAAAALDAVKSGKGGSPLRPRSSGGSGSSGGGGGGAKGNRGVLGAGGASADAAAGPVKGEARDTFGENDSLVSFLQQTGSILALAQMMDEQDGRFNAPTSTATPAKQKKERKHSGDAAAAATAAAAAAAAPPQPAAGRSNSGNGAQAGGGKGGGKAARGGGRRGSASGGLAAAAAAARAQEQCA